jgi:hypothetical protein
MHVCREWTLPRDYAGATWEGWYTAGFGRSRDSDALELSNFQVASRKLLALSDKAELPLAELERMADNGICETVEIVRENHWAVGWVEWIAIHSSNAAAIERAKELCERANDYPPLDESHWSNLEHGQAEEIWRGCYDTQERIAYIREHRSQFEFRDFADLMGCVRGKYFAGYASELLS